MALSQIAFDFGEPSAQPAAKPVKPAPAKAVAVIPPPAVAPQPKAEKSTRGRKSIQEAAAGAGLVHVPADEDLFKKMYYSMGEVSGMFHITPSLLRLWENEFDVLQPKKNGKGDRLFRPEDVKMLQLIYHLLRERKYTMQGAKDYIKNNKKAQEKFELVEGLKKLKAFLQELKADL